MGAGITADARGGLAGLRVVAFESRRADEISRLIAHHGGLPVSAPSMREVPLAENPTAAAWAERLLAGGIDVQLFLTGVGTRALLKLVAETFDADAVCAALARIVTVARGPKPVAALREWGLAPSLRVPEPNTWRELLATLDAATPVAGKTVAVQEYGVPNLELLRGLDERGAVVLQVPVYAWDLPADTAPLRAAVRAIAAGEADVLMFTTGRQIEHVLRVAREEGVEDGVRRALARLVVASIGPACTQALGAAGVPVDVQPASPKMGPLVAATAAVARARLAAKQHERPPVVVVTPAPAPGAALHDSLLMRALRREPVPRTPVWLMRQAGRYLPSYRALRAKVGLLELCKRPELVCEVTVDAVRQLGVDAAIIFSDLLVPLEAMGAAVEFVPGSGPVVAAPLRESEDLERIGAPAPGALDFVCEGVRLARAALPPDVPLLGFAGAPFTLAGYLIEGGTSRAYEHTKLVMYRDESRWHLLLERLARSMGAFLAAQHAAGAQAVQVFDTAAGCLSPGAYRRFVLPHTRTLLGVLREAAPGMPVILFATGAAGLLPVLREAGADAIGIDWRIDLDDAWRTIGYDTAVQGNLDPSVLFAEPAEIRAAAADVLARAGGRPGHVFNLGHGILPRTPVDNVRRLIDAVHEHGAREGQLR
ncbi:MAG TPA: uroporphyrinogen decarboxylase [Candidatus Limnocylindria bacterium]|nr:uroporphyrinogen decarboxylase [Candidatus Limnocylindria bacterium]